MQCIKTFGRGLSEEFRVARIRHSVMTLSIPWAGRVSNAVSRLCLESWLGPAIYCGGLFPSSGGGFCNMALFISIVSLHILTHTSSVKAFKTTSSKIGLLLFVALCISTRCNWYEVMSKAFVVDIGVEWVVRDLWYHHDIAAARVSKWLHANELV